VPKWGLEFSAERRPPYAGRIGLRRCLAGCLKATSGAGVKGGWSCKNGFFSEKLAQSEPSYDRAGTWQTCTTKWRLPVATGRAEHDRVKPETGSTGQEHTPASPNSMRRWTSFTERTTTAARPTLWPEPGTSQSTGRHRLTDLNNTSVAVDEQGSSKNNNWLSP
jgi:hypothetical protein